MTTYKIDCKSYSNDLKFIKKDMGWWKSDTSILAPKDAIRINNSMRKKEKY